MQVSRWRNSLLLKTAFVSSFSHPTTTAHLAFIHSTSAACDKWNRNWGPDVTQSSEASKKHVRIAVRQRRADTKKALKDLLYRSGCSRTSLEDEEQLWTSSAGQSNGTRKERKSKFSAQHASKSHRKKMKFKSRRDSFFEDSDEPETRFQATFGNKHYTWSYGSHSRGSTSGFEWREHLNWTNYKKTQGHTNEAESVGESSYGGSCDDRRILGLPPTGPLKLVDVKNAFHTAALKWHPDKHQGPSQAAAGEKFKLCVNAYKSLCSALS